MNIVQMHARIRELMDNEESPRFLAKTIDSYINSANDVVVSDKYDNERKQRKLYSFQSSGKLRDELYTLVKETPAITPVDSIIEVKDFPVDLFYTIGVLVTVNYVSFSALPLTYEETPIIYQDPKRRPTLDYPQRAYYVESGDGLKLIYVDGALLGNAKITYLKKPATVYFGTELAINTMMTKDVPYIANEDSTIRRNDTGTSTGALTINLLREIFLFLLMCFMITHS